MGSQGAAVEPLRQTTVIQIVATIILVTGDRNSDRAHSTAPDRTRRRPTYTVGTATVRPGTGAEHAPRGVR